MGIGTVGGGTAEVLTKNRELIARRAGQEIELKYILCRKPRPDHPFAHLIVHDIDTIVNDPEPGSYYSGRVTRIMDFGAFVEIAPGKEGLVHISQLDIKRTENVTDVVNVGDIVKVKVLEIDDKGRLNLSRREALIDLDGAVPENVLPEKQPRRERSDRPRGDRPRRDRNDRH